MFQHRPLKNFVLLKFFWDIISIRANTFRDFLFVHSDMIAQKLQCERHNFVVKITRISRAECFIMIWIYSSSLWYLPFRTSLQLTEQIDILYILATMGNPLQIWLSQELLESFSLSNLKHHTRMKPPPRKFQNFLWKTVDFSRAVCSAFIANEPTFQCIKNDSYFILVLHNVSEQLTPLRFCVFMFLPIFRGMVRSLLI